MIKISDLPTLKVRFRALIQEDLGLARFRENEDGDFLFRYERMNLKLVFDEDDPAFVWIAHFGFRWFDGDDPATVARADRCINEANYRIKAIKLARTTKADKDGDLAVSASISFLAENVASQDADTFERYLSQIKTGTTLFCELFGADDAIPSREPEAPTLRH
jgi:hypothetical protein